MDADIGVGDQLSVLFDDLSGAGPQPLPQATVTGFSGGWSIRRVVLPNTGSAGEVQIHFVFTSDHISEGGGVLIDDFRILQRSYPGSESLEGDDLTMNVFVNGVREYGLNDSYALNPGESLTVKTSSPGGVLADGDYYLLGEVFVGPPSFQQAVPDVWATLGTSTFVLHGGAALPFQFLTPLFPFGNIFNYVYPGGAAPFSCMLQAIVVKPNFVQSGFYASSDAFLLEFN